MVPKWVLTILIILGYGSVLTVSLVLAITGIRGDIGWFLLAMTVAPAILLVLVWGESGK